MTIRELFHEFALAVERRRQERDRDITLAWLVNVMEHGTKRIGPLEKFLTKKQERGPQPAAQQRMALEMIFGPNRGRPRTH